MSKHDPDLFARERHGLSFWLLEMLSEDVNRRDVASGHLMSFWGDVPPDSPAGEFEAQHERFGAAVRTAVKAPGFDTRDYVGRLIHFIFRAQNDRMESHRREHQRVQRITDRIQKQIEAKPGRPRYKTLERRLRRVICAKTSEVDLQSKLLNQSVTAGFVFAALDVALLEFPDLIRPLLVDQQHGYLVGQLLEKLGPAAACFIPDLFSLLDEAQDDYGFRYHRALAEVIRDDAKSVRAVVDRLDSERAHIAAAAAVVLHVLGARAAEFSPGLIQKLLEMTGPASLIRGAAILALGTVSKGNPHPIDTLLRLSEDPDLWIRGEALSALGEIGREPGRVVPRLIRALDDFEDPNPDNHYGSSHLRVAIALKAFGRDAVPALPELLKRLRREFGECDEGIIQLLPALGPLAKVAVPTLQSIAKEVGYGPDDSDSPIGKVIRELQALPDT